MSNFVCQILLGEQVLDGNSYHQCLFQNSTLIFRGGKLPPLVNCRFGRAVSIRLEADNENSVVFRKSLQLAGIGHLVQGFHNLIAGPHNFIGPRARDLTHEDTARHQLLSAGCALEWFRFFDRPEHADDFVQGSVRISTLSACRAYEKHGQGDRGEGTLSYTHRPLAFEDTGFDEVTARLGMKLGPGAFISGNVSMTNVPDAFILSCTAIFSPILLGPTFGMHCVRIRYPLFVFELLKAAISEHVKLGDCFCGAVTYADRVYRDLEPMPAAHPALLKPRDGYVDQHEERMIWLPTTSLEKLDVLFVKAPGLSQFCERVA